MDYEKRLVFDFDDTISFTQNRDWENANPNLPLIEKMNKLYDEGWIIDIFTARGTLSCKSREEAQKVHGPVIIKWLQKNNVKYHSLSFDKPFARYYIDDKALTPEMFIDLKL